jgi:hypothetical protein
VVSGDIKVDNRREIEDMDQNAAAENTPGTSSKE